MTIPENLQLQFHEQALRISPEVADHRGEGYALWNMSRALDQLWERAQAIKHAEQALTIFEQIEDPNVAKCGCATWYLARAGNREQS